MIGFRFYTINPKNLKEQTRQAIYFFSEVEPDWSNKNASIFFQARAHLYWVILQKFKDGNISKFTIHMTVAHSVESSMVNLYIKVNSILNTSAKLKGLEIWSYFEYI